MERPHDSPQERMRLMIAAIRDVAPPGHPAPVGLTGGSPRHKRLFDEYVAALRHVRQRAEERWSGLVEGIMENEDVTRAEADAQLRATSPAGPGEDSEFVAAVRRYWLKCVALNDAGGPAERVPPEEFILQWPAEAGAAACVAVLTQLTYLPVGLDDQGRWI